MSVESKVIEGLFRLAGVSKPRSPKVFYKKLRKNAILYKKGEKIPSRVAGVRTEEGVYCGMRYYVFIPSEVESSAAILYLHGSGYVNAHKKAQEKFASYIARNTHAKVFFPIYPKLPICTAVSCIAVLNNFYVFLRKQGRVVFLGDSSGAALCLVLSQEKADADKLVLISPYLDIYPDREAEEMQKKDVLLSVDRLRAVARLWAYDLPYDSPKLSPIYGDYAGKEMLILAGGNEVFLPSIKKFWDACRKRKMNVEYEEKKGQPHCYPLFPTPEGKEGKEMIVHALVRFLYTKGEDQ